MAPSATQSLGRHAETRAKLYLERHGLRCLQRNFYCRGGEIDLIMLDGQCLVFVEVRYRRQHRLADAAYTVGPRKQARLIRAARVFLQTAPHYNDCVMRFDVVGIDAGADEKVRLSWLRDAFRP